MIKHILLTVILLLATQPSHAHPGGHEPVDEQQAVQLATNVAQQFIEFDPGLGFGKLDQSWKQIPPKNSLIHKKGDGYFIVSLKNSQQGKTLYFLISVSGEVYDANFTGNFPGLK